MALSTDVNLPRTHEVAFPNRCVVCNLENPSSHVRIITGTIGWWTWILWHFGRPFIVKAPACRMCAWKLHGRRAVSLLIMVATVWAALWFLLPLLKESLPRGLARWAALGLALACVLPQLIIEALLPKALDVTAYSDSVTYDFASAEYAADFAGENYDAAWVKVNGTNILDHIELLQDVEED